jgi:hypothetical protein
VPDKLVDLLQDLHDGSSATIKAFGGESRPFEIRGGVRQGCNIAPLLFNTYLDFVTKQAAAQFTGSEHKSGVHFSYNYKGQPFKVPVGDVGTVEAIALLMYADDMVLLAEEEGELNHYIQVLEAVTQRWGLTINVRKTKIWHGSWKTPGTVSATQAPVVSIRGETVEEVEEFKYLGSTLADSGGIEKEIDRRIGLAVGKFAELRHIWMHKLISLDSKMGFYRAFIPPTLLYGCECWPVTKEQTHKLNVVHMRFLRKILGVNIRHKLQNEDIAARCGIQQVPDLLSLARMRWAGHLVRMDEDRLPRKVLFGALAQSERGRGRPKKRLFEPYVTDFPTLARANGVTVSERITRAAVASGRDHEPWWTTATDKVKWRAYLDKAWPRKPSAP